MRILIATDAWHPQVNGVVRTLTSLALSAVELGADIGVAEELRCSGVEQEQVFEQAASLTEHMQLAALPESSGSRPSPQLLHGATAALERSFDHQHGGFGHDDTNVILLLSHSSFRPSTVRAEVGTVQVAPTILKALGIDPSALDAVRIEGTSVLPAVPLR